MNILAIGDIVGQCGIEKVKEEITGLKEKYNIDFVIANGENAADGMGLLERQFITLRNAGVDCVTMGNHTWAKKDIFNFIDDDHIIRPANLPKDIVGKGFNIFEKMGKKIAVVNLLGRATVNVLSENPFTVVDEIVSDISDDVDIIIVDFHAEATAEKKAMAYFLDGKVTAVFGTHTHVQTADEQILPNKTAFISDIGMTRPSESIIGMDIFASLKRFVTTLPEKYRISTSEPKLEGVVFEINDETNKVNNITRIQIK